MRNGDKEGKPGAGFPQEDEKASKWELFTRITNNLPDEIKINDLLTISYNHDDLSPILGMYFEAWRQLSRSHKAKATRYAISPLVRNSRGLFATIESIRNATDPELLQVEGIGPTSLNTLREMFCHGNHKADAMVSGQVQSILEQANGLGDKDIQILISALLALLNSKRN